MNGILEILLEALEDADRKTLNEIALDEFEKDYSKVKMKNDDIRAELIALANKKYGESDENESNEDSEAEAEAEAEAKAAFAAKVREEAIAKAAAKRKVRKLKHRKTGRIMTWTPALAKLDDLDEVE